MLLRQSRRKNAHQKLKKFQLSDFEVVNDKTCWVSYDGSLTTPKCLEVVTWFVAMKPYDITNSQVYNISSLNVFGIYLYTFFLNQILFLHNRWKQ